MSYRPLPPRSAALLAAAALLATGAALAPDACAGDDDQPGLHYQAGALDLTLTLEAGFGLFSAANAGNGIGSTSRTGERAGGRSWAEGFVAPGLGASYDLGGSRLYGGIKAVGSATRGQGEAQATSTTSDRPEHLGLEEAYLGWASGSSVAALGEDAIDISAGRQGFSVGDGFLIVDGAAEGNRRGAYVIGPRGAFDRTAILRVNTAPVRADLFHLQGSTDQTLMRGTDAAATRLHGGNIEWFGGEDAARSDYAARNWYLGATFLNLYEADRGVAAARDGMKVYAVRTGGTPLGSLGEAFSDFALYSEYAVEKNDGAGSKKDARAWYVEPQYTFPALPWTPRISYRYARFSGDNNSSDGTDHAWDALYSGGGARGFGSWDQGEIYARYVGGNSNVASQMIHLRTQPTDALAVGAIWYWHAYDRRPSGVTDDALMREVNVYAEWETPLPGLSLAAVLGAAQAGRGRRQELGTTDANDRTTWLGQIVFGWSF